MADIDGVLLSKPKRVDDPRCVGIIERNGERVTCGRLLAVMLTEPWVIYCSRCHHRNCGPPGAST